MQFKLNGLKYVSRLVSGSGNTAAVILDTGSPYTVISVESLCKLSGMPDIDKAHEFLNRCNSVDCISFSGDIVHLVPIVMRNVIIGGDTFDSLYMYVNTSSKKCTSLIGADIISGCRILGFGKEIDLTEFDASYNKRVFDSIVNGKIVYEILNLIKYDEPVPTKKVSRLESLLKKSEG